MESEVGVRGAVGCSIPWFDGSTSAFFICIYIYYLCMYACMHGCMYICGKNAIIMKSPCKNLGLGTAKTEQGSGL